MDIQRPDAGKRRTRRRLTIAVTALLGIVIIGVALARIDITTPSIPRTSLWVDNVRKGPMLREVRSAGTLVPREMRWLSAQSPARVERVLAKPGAAVTADTVIMELSSPEMVDAWQTAQASVAAAEAEMIAQEMTLYSQLLDYQTSAAAVRAEYEPTQMQAEAERKLVESRIIPPLQARRTEVAAEQLKARIGFEDERVTKQRRLIGARRTADQARVDQLRKTLELRQRQVEQLQVRAGIDGILQEVVVQDGQQVASGGNLARVARPDELVARLRVPEAQAKDVSQGLPVTVRISNADMKGQVARVEPGVTDGTVLVEVGFTQPLPAGARPDLSVDGVIEIERLDDVLFTGRPGNAQTGMSVSVFRVDADGVARRVPVQVGRTSTSLMEVTGGLAEGDAIILSDTSQWSSHASIRLD